MVTVVIVVVIPTATGFFCCCCVVVVAVVVPTVVAAILVSGARVRKLNQLAKKGREKIPQIVSLFLYFRMKENKMKISKLTNFLNKEFPNLEILCRKY